MVIDVFIFVSIKWDRESNICDTVSECCGVSEGFEGSFSPLVVWTRKVKCREVASGGPEMESKPGLPPLLQVLLSFTPHSVFSSSCAALGKSLTFSGFLFPLCKENKLNLISPQRSIPFGILGFWMFGNTGKGRKGPMSKEASVHFPSPRNSGLGSCSQLFLYWSYWTLNPACVCVFSCWDHWSHWSKEGCNHCSMPGACLHSQTVFLFSKDESRIKAVVMDVKPVDFREYGRRLIMNIRKNALIWED